MIRGAQIYACRVFLVFAAALVIRIHAQGAPRVDAFDGAWNTILTCPDAEEARGFVYRFTSTVTDGVLHGEKGTRDRPGWLELDGPIRDDGSATLLAQGIVGSAPFAVGHAAAGTPFGYHVQAQFSASTGAGHRIEGRSCSFEFARIGN